MNLIKAQIRNKLRLVLRPLMETDEAMEFVIDDVLSPLDGLGECVKEHRFESKQAFVEIWDDFEGPIWDAFEGPVWTSERFNPGDRIAIYKLPKED